MSRNHRISVPMPVAPAAEYHGFFRLNDLLAIAARVGRDLAPSANLEQIADALDEAAVTFINLSLISAADPPGHMAKWCRQVSSRAAAFLAAFEIENAGDWHPDHAARVLLLEPGAAKREPLDENADDLLRSILRQVRFIEHRAKLAAEGYESRKGTHRRPPIAELAFVAALRSIFEKAFGTPAGLGGTVVGADEPDGPFIRFCIAVAARLQQDLPSHDIRRSRRLIASLKRLSEPKTVRERLRDVASGGGLPRKRKAIRH
jgi:hypothetical protein